MLSVAELKTQIRQHVFADVEPSIELSLPDTLAKALVDRDFAFLCRVCAYGKGWNDKSKEVVCDILNEERTYTAKGMQTIIARHCGLSEEAIDLHFDYLAAQDKKKRAMEVVLETFSNGQDVFDFIEGYIDAGYTTIRKEGRKTFLANSHNRGVHLCRVPVKNYAIAEVEYLRLKALYEAEPAFKSLTQSVALN